MPVMTLRGYARHRACALSTVQLAIASGRISTVEGGKVDSDAADRQWRKNTRLYMPVMARRQEVPRTPSRNPTLRRW